MGLWVLACTGQDPEDLVDTSSSEDTSSEDTSSSETGETGEIVYDPWPFVDSVLSFEPGEGAGYGQDQLPDVVTGPPEAPGGAGASTDVLSLGKEGVIVVSFRGLDVVDGPGVDLIVFENPFPGWTETGVVGLSEDGEVWIEFGCDPSTEEGCAGVEPVHASSTNGVDARDVELAGGDAFDLADIGLERARYLRIRDTGANSYEGVAGGFDLDAAVVVNSAAW